MRILTIVSAGFALAAGVAAVAPQRALADDACADGDGKLCETTEVCYKWEGSKCSGKLTSYKYYSKDE